MAMRGNALVVAVAMLVMLVAAEAAYDSFDSSAMMEFATPGLAAEMEDLHMSMYPTVEDGVEEQFLDEPARRMLATARRSYVSYGALNGNRSPCPARSGRSYYTPNCNSRAGPAQPYRRGCYQITRCARG
jgi:hypothetical protein